MCSDLALSEIESKTKNGTVFVSSKVIADKFGKIHRDVLRAIENLDCSDDFRVRNFAHSSYITSQNKTLLCFDVTKDGFAYLCMGFTGDKAAQWKERFIEYFNQMERIIKGDVMEITLTESIDIVSLRLDEIKAAGSSWGRTGAEIRKHKKRAIEELYVLLGKAQLQLGFEII